MTLSRCGTLSDVSSVICDACSLAIGYSRTSLRRVRAPYDIRRARVFDLGDHGFYCARAEFGSYAFVHPVIRRLPPEHHAFVEKGHLQTFGRVMPVLMALWPVLSIAYAPQASAGLGAPIGLRWMSAIVFVAALIS